MLGSMAGDDATQPPPVDGEGHFEADNPNQRVNNGTNYDDESSSKSVEIYVSTTVSTRTGGLITFKSEDLESSRQLQLFLNQFNDMPSTKRMKMTLTALPEEELDSPSSYSCPESPTVPGKMKRVDAREARLQKSEDAHIRRNQKGNTDEEDEDTSDSGTTTGKYRRRLDLAMIANDIWPKESRPPPQNLLQWESSLSSNDSSVDELSADSPSSYSCPESPTVQGTPPDLWPKESPPSSPLSDYVTLDWKNKLELMPDDDEKKWCVFFHENTEHWLMQRHFLYAEGLRLRPEWLASVVPDCPSVSLDVGQIYFTFMDTDISITSTPILPPDGAFWSSKVEHVNFFMLQVEEVVDISEHFEEWFPDEFSPEREYRLLSLTDGVERVEGFEYEPLGDNIEWGSKLAIHQTTIVGCEGLLKLVKETCQLKGFPEDGTGFKASTQLADKVNDGGAFLNSVKKSYEQWVRDSSNGPGQISNGKSPSSIASGAGSPLSGQEATQDDRRQW